MRTETRPRARTILGTVAALGAALASGSCLDRWSEDSSGSNPCAQCHGLPARSGDPLVQAAPPIDLDGHTTPSALGVGAHQAHLQASATQAGVPCSDCHLVPDSTYSPGHLDTALPAEVTFAGVSLSGGAAPQWNRAAATCAGTWCHGPSDPTGSVSPEWTSSDGPLGCASCHLTPPPDPHPPMAECWNCHGNVDENLQIVDPALHVNGTVDF